MHRLLILLDCNDSVGGRSTNCTSPSESNNDPSSSIDTTTPLIIVLIVIIVAAIILTIYLLHRKQKLPQACYGLGELTKGGQNGKSYDIDVVKDAEKDLIAGYGSTQYFIWPRPQLVKFQCHLMFII